MLVKFYLVLTQILLSKIYLGTLILLLLTSTYYSHNFDSENVQVLHHSVT